MKEICYKHASSMSKTYPHAYMYFQYFHCYFLYHRQSVDYFSNKQEDGFALCTSVFVNVSATTALHKISKNHAVEDKYVFVGLVLLIAMGGNFGYGEVSFHTYSNPSHNRMLNSVK